MKQRSVKRRMFASYLIILLVPSLIGLFGYFLYAFGPSIALLRDEQGYTHRFLSDRWPVGAAAKLYGVWSEEVGQADRGTFILDADGVVRYAVHNPAGQARDEATYVAALDAMGIRERPA